MNRTNTTLAALAATAVLGTFGFAATTAYAAGPGGRGPAPGPRAPTCRPRRPPSTTR